MVLLIYHDNLVLLGLPDLLSDTIAILLSLLGHAAATLLALGHGFENANLLQLLKAVADDTPGRTAEVTGEGTPPLLGAIYLREGANPSALAHVQPAGEGRAADVEPVLIIGGKLPGDRGLHEVHKLGKGDLALLLEVDSIALHKLVRVDILDGDAGLLT